MISRNNTTNIASSTKLLEKAGIKPSKAILEYLALAKDPLTLAGAIATLPKKYHNNTFLDTLLEYEAYADRIAREIFIISNIKKTTVNYQNLSEIIILAKSKAQKQQERIANQDRNITQKILAHEVYDEKINEESIKSLILSGASADDHMVNHLIKIKAYSLISFLLIKQPQIFTEHHFNAIFPKLLEEKNYSLMALFLTRNPNFKRLQLLQTNLENLAFSYFKNTKFPDSNFILLLYQAGFRLSTTKKDGENILAIAFLEKNISHLNFLLSKEWIGHFSQEELIELLPKLLQEKMFAQFRSILNERNDIFKDYMENNGAEGGLFLAVLDENPNLGHIKYFCEQGADPEAENQSNQSALSICKEKHNYDGIKIFLSYAIKKLSTESLKDSFETLLTNDIKNISLLENLIHHEATNLEEKKKIISELVSHAIERARTSQEVINIITLLENVKNIDYFHRSQKVITLVEPIWKNVKVTEKWSLMIDEAKKKIIKLSQAEEKLNFNKEVYDFLKTPVSSTQQLFSLNTEYAQQYQQMVKLTSLPALLKR